MLRLFLSYGREDKAIVEDCYDRLRSEGFAPWMDSRDLLPGQAWEATVVDNLKSAHFILVFLSSRCVDRRGFRHKEIRLAIDQWERMYDSDAFLIPIRIDECPVPKTIRRFQWVDLFVPGSWERLVSAFHEGARRRGLKVGITSSPGMHDSPSEDVSRSEDTELLTAITIQRTIDRALRFWAVEISQKDLSVSVDNQLDRSAKLTLQRGQVEDLFLNLVGNAVKYSHLRKPLTIALRQDGADVRIEISNIGAEVQKREEEDIFVFHRRGEREDVAPEGIGLGLYIAKSIMRSHAGNFHLDSEPLSGAAASSYRTKFVVTFPRSL